MSVFRAYSVQKVSWTAWAQMTSVSVAAALLLTTALTAGPAVAASEAAPVKVDWTQPGATSGATAPDSVSASMLARLRREPVEDLSQRTESSQTFALPDGQWRSDLSMGPEWVPTGEDPTTEAGWEPLDTGLVSWSDGTYRPGAHPADLVFSGASDAPARVVSGVNDQGGAFELWWDGALPKPIVEGDAIRYEDVKPGIDLVFSVTATGYEQFFVAKSAEALANSGDLSLSFTSPDDPLKIKNDTLVVKGDDGASVADVSGVAVWDADADANRMHPVADMASGSGGKADRSAVPVDLNTAPESTAIDADVTVSGDTGTVTVDTADVPVDKSTDFPVVIDPSVNLTLSFDTYVCSICTPDHSSDTELLIGTPDSGNGKYRAFMNVNVSKVLGKYISAATLKLYEFHAWSCTAKSWEVWSTSTTSSSTRWSNMPALGTKYASTTATKGYSSSCPDGTVTQDVKTLVQAWANSTTTTRGLALKATSETDNFSWKRFYSGNSSSNKPVLAVTYSSYPNTPTNVKVNGSSPAAGTVFYTNDTTPTFSATVSDADGGKVTGKFAFNGGSAVSGTQVASGSASEYTTGVQANGASLSVTVAGYDGSLTSKATAAPTWSVVVDTVPPGATTITTPQFTEGQWLATAPSSASATFTSTDATLFEYSIDAGPTKTVTATSGSATIQTLPLNNGGHTIKVRSVDRAGNTSDYAYRTYGVGTIGIASPGTAYKTTNSARVIATVKPNLTSVIKRTVYWRASGTANGAGYTDATGSTDDWTPIETLLPTTAGGNPAVDYVWSAAETAAGAGFERIPFLMDVQVCFTTVDTGAVACTWRDDPSTHDTVLRIPHAFGDNYPVASAGPGQVAMWTGEFNTSTTDLEVPGFTGSMSLSRSYNTFQGDTEHSVFGPGWVPSFDGADVGSAGLSVFDTTGDDGLLTFQDVDGSYLLYAEPSHGKVAQQVGTYLPLDEDTAALGYTVSIAGTGMAAVLSLVDDDAVTTTWTQQTAGNWVQTSVIEPGSAATTTFTRDANGNITRVLAPAPPGVNCTTIVAGCRALNINYTSIAVTGQALPQTRVASVTYTAWKPNPSGSGGTIATDPVTTYAYNTDGYLITVTDNRSGIATNYGYLGSSDAGVPLLTMVKPGGLAAWNVAYADTVRGDDSVVQVTRDAPVSGAAVPMARYVYGIATDTATAGLPDVRSDVGAWGQTRVPSVGFAVFGPGEDPGNGAISAAQWRNAQMTYTDALGYTLNTAEFGAGAWQYTATQYDADGRVVRELDTAATGELRARSALNGGRPVPDTDVNALSSITRYNAADITAPSAITWDGGTIAAGTVLIPAGSLVTDTWAPAADDAGQGLARVHTHIVYDEGAPNSGVNPLSGQKFALATTTTVTKAVATSGSFDPADSVATGETVLSQSTSGYNPIDGASTTGVTSGWILGAPTVTTDVMPNAANNIVSKVRYDSLGRIVESRSPGSTGTDAATSRTIYYTAGANTDDTACGNVPQWAGLQCVTKTGETTPTLPVTRVTGYNYLLQPTTTTETLGSVVRTSTTTYLADGRTDTTAVTVTGLTGTTALPTTKILYDTSTGLPTTTQTMSGTTVLASVSTTSDKWGRNVTYVDRDGVTTTNTFDAAGRLATVNDTKHTVTYSYDGTDALGNQERRGVITGMTVSGVGAFGAAYDGAGNMVLQTMPGGVTQEATYSLAGATTSMTYTGTDDDGEATPLIAWVQDTDLFGRVVHETTPTDTQGLDDIAEYTRVYTYDRAGRLVTVNDRTAAPGALLDEDASDSTITPCITRSYTFDVRGNRLTRSSATSGTNGVCPTAGTSTETWTYNAADRVQTGANATGTYVYDGLGRQTTVPAIDTPSGMAAGNLTIGYYVDDQVRSLTQNGTTTTFTLDPMERRDTATSVTGTKTSTLVRHYADATDDPAWAVKTGTDGIAHTTWYGTSIGGDLGITMTDSTVSLEVADIHGDTATSLTIAAGTVSAINGYSDYDEYGRPIAATARPDTGAVRYGWLGAQQRATDDNTGLMLMGVRLYNPTTGQFTSPDPVAGGNTTAYMYPQDPINKYDLDGKMWGWLKKARSIAKVVAKVADVASFIPGPIGMVCAGVATAGYLASGDYKSAAFAAAGLVPGGKLLATAAKIASRAGKAVKEAKFVAKAVTKVSKIVKRSGCNSFEPETQVTVSDGSTKDIEDVVVGDEVLSSDGTANVAQPVTALIRHLDQHTWVDLTIATSSGAETLSATKEHPFWVVSRSGVSVGDSTAGTAGAWSNAIDLSPGDVLTTADGTAALVLSTATRQSTDWAYNLSIANTHTYYVGDQPVLVHNAKGLCEFHPDTLGRDAARANGAHASTINHMGHYANQPVSLIIIDVEKRVPLAMRAKKIIEQPGRLNQRRLK